MKEKRAAYLIHPPNRRHGHRGWGHGLTTSDGIVYNDIGKGKIRILYIIKTAMGKAGIATVLATCICVSRSSKNL